MAKKGERLIGFYGTECGHCHAMEPVIKQFEKETGKKIEKLEVWHNGTNAAFFEECDGGFCGGVPFFYNEKTKAKICGEATLAELKKWAGAK